MISATGSFEHLDLGPIPVCIPEGLTFEGLPVMVYPPEGFKIISGAPYHLQFTPVGTLTQEREGVTYRTCRCTSATLQDEHEEDIL